MTTIRVIVGGGDGTVMWVIEEMIKYSIDVSKCPIGIVPFGTGNDFSRVLGWGGSAPLKMVGPSLDNLKALISRWRNAITEEFDVWEITIETNENGFFRKVSKSNGAAIKEEMKENDGKKKKTMKKHMANYFSLGIDARIGLGFDKHRSNNACCNKVVYCMEGFKKMFLSTQRIKKVVDSLEVLHDADLESNEVSIFFKKNIFF